MPGALHGGGIRQVLLGRRAAMNGEVFRAYVEQSLAPILAPGDVDDSFTYSRKPESIAC